MGVGKSDADIDDTTDEMMDMLVKTVTSKQKSRVRRRERSSMANRKSRKKKYIIHKIFVRKTHVYFWQGIFSLEV